MTRRKKKSFSAVEKPVFWFFHSLFFLVLFFFEFFSFLRVLPRKVSQRKAFFNGMT